MILSRISTTPYVPNTINVVAYVDINNSNAGKKFKWVNCNILLIMDLHGMIVGNGTSFSGILTSSSDDYMLFNVNLNPPYFVSPGTPFKIRWASYTDGTFSTLERSTQTVNFIINDSIGTALDYLGNPSPNRETAYFRSVLSNTTSPPQVLYARYEYYNGSQWVALPTSLPPGFPSFTAVVPNTTTVLEGGTNINILGNGTRVRVGLYQDQYFTTQYTGSDVSISSETITYGQLDHVDLKIFLTEKFTNPLQPAPIPRPTSENSTTTIVTKSYNLAQPLPIFTPLPSPNLTIVKNVNIPPPPPPNYVSGNFTLNASYDSCNAIALPSGVVSNRNEPQYFGTTIFLDEVPKPEEFGQGALNNIKVKSAHPALFNSFPTGTTSADYSKADYMELIVNNVPIAVGNLDTSKIPAIVPGTNPQSALYRFSTNFTGGDQDFSIVKGNWVIDTTTGNPTSGQYVTDNMSFSNRYNETVFNRMPMDNFIISTDIYVDDVSTGINPNPIGNATNFAGIRIRSTNPGDPIEQSGYLIAYENSQIKILKGDDPVATFSTGVPAFNTGNKRNLEVHANGNDIQVYVDGTFIGQYVDPYYTYTSGYTSFVTTGRKVGYDNVLISSYASPIQLLSQALRKGENSIVIKTFGNKNSIIDVKGSIGGVDLSTANIPPDLQALNGGNPVDINSHLYKHSSIPGFQGAELDRKKAYWSASTQSALGIAGKIIFKNKEGGAIHKTKDEFSKVNSMMTNLTSLLGLIDDTFNSHLNIIR
ncbi:MAG: hypothetical protein KatS3mg068_1264 [Candidatus Sericytochromatia bacterium]|nr:MAG: hypothetical protein KatS3mg068_1264 [Candidatus Sericytochromatia bacterium]